MTDALGNEVEEGSLIYVTHTQRIGHVQGGVTNGGKLRYISHEGHKESADTWNYVIITLDQARTFLIDARNHAQERIDEEEGLVDAEVTLEDVKESWWHRKNLKIVNTVDKILEL